VPKSIAAPYWFTGSWSRGTRRTMVLALFATVVGPGLQLATSVSTASPGARAASLPRIFSTIKLQGEAVINLFPVRPHDIVVDSADGGELVIHWTQWTSSNAYGSGRAHPDHGSYAIKVHAFDNIGGYFTRLTITSNTPAVGVRRDRMVLCTDDGQSLSWIEWDWAHNPESGFHVWRGGPSGGD
jgi:hypothetical protein